jgi:hypothetical protein
LYAASLGWNVWAFDQSAVAREKALATAAKLGLSLEYDVMGIEHFPEVHFPEGYDLIGLFYVHMPSALRSEFHRKMVKSLKSGGSLILECFSPRQLEYSSGGPKDTDMLYTVDLALEDFSELSDLYVSETVVDLAEGPFHQGPASVIRLIGVKS